MKHHEVCYVVTDTEGKEHISTKMFHGFETEEEVRAFFWRDDFRRLEFLTPNARMASISITNVSER